MWQDTVSRYQPTPDDLALEELLEELCVRWRDTWGTEKRVEILKEYRELKAQRSVEFQAHLASKFKVAA